MLHGALVLSLVHFPFELSFFSLVTRIIFVLFVWVLGISLPTVLFTSEIDRTSPTHTHTKNFCLGIFIFFHLKTLQPIFCESGRIKRGDGGGTEKGREKSSIQSKKREWEQISEWYFQSIRIGCFRRNLFSPQYNNHSSDCSIHYYNFYRLLLLACDVSLSPPKQLITRKASEENAPNLSWFVFSSIYVSCMGM